MPSITDLGSGNGRIYVTTSNPTVIISSVANTAANALNVLTKAAGNRGNISTSIGLAPYRYHINDATDAPLNSTTGATEITDWVVSRGFNNQFPAMSILAAEDTLSVNRNSSVQFYSLKLDAPTAESSYAITASSNQVHADGDIICLVGYNIVSGGEYTIEAVNSLGNLVLDADMVFDGGESHQALWLRYRSSDAKWYEIMRNPSTTSFSVSQARTNGLGVQGDDANIVTTTSGGSLVLDPTADSKVVTLTTGAASLGSNFAVTAASAKAGDVYHIVFKTNYTIAGGDVTLFGTAVANALVPTNASGAIATASSPVTVSCYYDGTNWNFATTVDITRYELDLGDVIYKKYAKCEYNFAVNGGTIGTYTIGAGVIPAGSIIPLNEVMIRTVTALTSGGAALVAFGAAADNDALDSFRLFSATLYASVGAADAAKTTLTPKALYVGSATNVTFSISTAALTAGRVVILVPYIENA